MPSNNERARLQLCKSEDEHRGGYFFLKRKFYVPLKLGHDFFFLNLDMIFKGVSFLSFQVSFQTVKQNEDIIHIVLWGTRF